MLTLALSALMVAIIAPFPWARCPVSTPIHGSTAWRLTDTDISVFALESRSEAERFSPGQVFRQRMFGHTGFLTSAGLIA